MLIQATYNDGGKTMNKIVEENVKEQGIHIHVVPSKKFKTINIVAKFRAPLSRDTITMRALLPYLLRQGTKSYPSEQALQLKLDELYGAVLRIDGAKKGDHHIMSVRLEIANQNYISDESSIITEALTLLKEVIYEPNTTDDSFDPVIFKREKETLQQKMNAVIDDKMAYANRRMIDEMCAGEAYATHVHGYEEDLAKLDAATMYKYYQSLVVEDRLDIYVLGDFDEQLMKEELTSRFPKREHAGKITTKPENWTKRDEPQVIIDKQDIQQAKLHLGYRTNSTYQDDDYHALQVFNGIFGGFPSSKLFINVREKNSLAYYAASRIESLKGLLIVFSGIAAADYEQAKEIIELQMTAMKNGEFTEAEVTETKDLLINQLLETLDNPQGIIELLYQQVLANKVMTPDDFIAGIKQVTTESVRNIANKIEADTVYLLTSEGDGTDE